MAKESDKPKDEPSGKHGAEGTAKRTGPGDSHGKHRAGPDGSTADKGGKK